MAPYPTGTCANCTNHDVLNSSLPPRQAAGARAAANERMAQCRRSARSMDQATNTLAGCPAYCSACVLQAGGDERAAARVVTMVMVVATLAEGMGCVCGEGGPGPSSLLTHTTHTQR